MGMGVLYRARMQTIAEALASDFADGMEPTVAVSTFGTADPAAIAAAVEAACERGLGRRPSGCLFYEGGVGCVFGLDLGGR